MKKSFYTIKKDNTFLMKGIAYKGKTKTKQFIKLRRETDVLYSYVIRNILIFNVIKSINYLSGNL